MKIMAEEILQHHLSINYIGYLTAPIGLGDGARNYLAALWQQGWRNINCIDMTYATGHLPTETIPYFKLGSMRQADINILHINAYDLPHMISLLDERYLKNSYNIGVWAWETTEIPKAWHDRFGYLNEIWTLSDFVNRAIARFTTMPVLTMPYIVPHLDGIGDRKKFHLHEDEFIFLFNFDYESVHYRKNPHAVINAFRSAFSENTNARLVIKTANAHKHNETKAELVQATQGAKVTFIDKILSTSDQHQLIASCDAYISLHRAEGFGLGMAEAMSLGKPVIATGWSGNLDFMNISNALLVKYNLARIPHDIAIYPPETIWAQAHVEHAAQIMKEVYFYPEKYRGIALQGQKDVRSLLSHEHIGNTLSARLHLIKEKILTKAQPTFFPETKKLSLLKRIKFLLLAKVPVKYHKFLFYFFRIYRKMLCTWQKFRPFVLRRRVAPSRRTGG